MVVMLVSPQNPYVAILTPSVMLFGSRAFGRGLGHEGDALSNEVNALIKETPESSLTLLVLWGHNEKTVVHEPRNGFSPATKSALILDFPAFRTMRNACLLFNVSSVLAAQTD